MGTINLHGINYDKTDILFLALNPPSKSNNNGKYFFGNLSFWNVLYDRGLITRGILNPLEGEDYVFRGQDINREGRIYEAADLCFATLETKSPRVKVKSHHIDSVLYIE